MKVQVTENAELQLTEVYNPVKLVTNSGEYLSICMRDSGFEFTYGGENYIAQNGEISKIKTEYCECEEPLPQASLNHACQYCFKLIPNLTP